MSIIVTTTGLTSSVFLKDLGSRTLDHPFSKDFEPEFGQEQVSLSVSLQTAVNNLYVEVEVNGDIVSDLSLISYGVDGATGSQGIQGEVGATGSQGI